MIPVDGVTVAVDCPPVRRAAGEGTEGPCTALCAHHLFERQAGSTPDHPAAADKAEQLTYRELDERSNQVAHVLREYGVGPDKLVGVCLERSVDLVVALLGVWKAGGAYVPLDPAYPSERIGFMVEDAALPLVLTENKLGPLFADSNAHALVLDEDWHVFADRPTSRVEAGTTPDHLAYVMYTSGSTGQPKGAMIHHRGLVNYVTWAIATYDVRPGDSVPVHSSIAFDLTVTSLYPALLAGGSVELLSDEAGAANLVAALRRRGGRGLVKITPAHLDALALQLRPEELAGLTRTFVIGGENLPAESLSLWRDCAPETRLINEYGPTETVVGCSIHEVAASDPRNGPVPIGRPIANTELHVLNEAGQPVGVGTTGEIYIGGFGVARGYLNRPDLTAEKFLPDWISGRPEARLYRTGDLGRFRSDGILEFLGRIDSQVKVRGYRIELGEIEATLAGHPAVQSCAIATFDDATGGKQLAGYVRLRAGEPREPSSAEALQSFLRRQLPEYMVPAYVVFLDSMPLTLNGKIDRRALPVPNPSPASSTKEHVPPRNELETSIAAIWSELLKVDRIGVHDDFFELGGHSLLAIRALARIRDRLEVELSPQVLFENSSLATFAAQVAQARPGPQAAQTIPRRSDDGPAPASHVQQQLWLLGQLVPNSPAYNIVDVFPIGGDFSASALKRGLAELLARHDILRTSFDQLEGQLVQRVTPACEPLLPEVDLTRATDEQRQAGWAKVIEDQGRTPFDLARAPLFRATVVHWSATEHRVLLVLHHILADEWSMEIIHKELRELYDAFSRGQTPSLEPLAIQYADYAVWQRDTLRGEALRDQVAYWRNELREAPQVLALTADEPRPTVPSFCGATERFALPRDVLTGLLALGREEQATLFMTLAAAFALLLHRQSGQDDLLIGTPVSGRSHSETQGLVGCFINPIVLRTRLTKGLDFRGLLRQVRARALAGFAHADLPFEQLVAEIAPVRDPARSPVFQAMFILHDRDGVSRVARVGEQAELETGTAKFDLTLAMAETRDGLAGAFEYSTDLYHADTIRALARSFAQLLRAVIAESALPVARLPLVADEDRRRLVDEFNRTAVDFAARDLCLHELVTRQAQRTPESTAVVAGQESMTYAELVRRSDALARHLRSAGVEPDHLVGLMVERSTEMVIGMLGILKAGGAYVPLDPAYPPDRLGYVVQNSRMQVLVTHRDLDRDLATKPATVIRLDADADAIAQHLGKGTAPSVNRPEHLAYALYTSGSTGMPKGVGVSHGALVNFLLSMQREPGLAASDVLLAITTLSFDIAGLELHLPLICGAKVIIASREEVVDARRLLPYLAPGQCTLLQATPATWRALLEAGWTGSPQLKALCGGEAMPLDLARALIPRCAELWNMYGPTETTVWSTVHKVASADAQPPIGRPIANTQVYVLDEHLHLAPPGAVGELYIGGRGLARGYLHRDDLTRERFVASPLAEDARLYRTGDLARWRSDGVLECFGRTDHQVKLRGYRIELGEIEHCIAKEPTVRQVVVVAREDVPGDKRLVAYLVADGTPADLVERLRARLQASLPDYMVPAHFLLLAALPLTANGKVDRKALPAPSHDDIAPTADGYVPPTSELEIGLARAWQRVLGLPRIGIHDNFFQLGGNSVALIRLMIEMEKATGFEWTLGTIFRAPTIARLVQSLGSTAAEEASLVVPLQAEGGETPVFCLSGVMLYQELAQSLGKAQPVFGVYVAEEHALTKQVLRGEKISVSSAQLAKAYYDAIVRVAPKGPYRLAGVSFGGIVSLEVASLMKRAGQQVEIVVLLDTLSPEATRRKPWKWLTTSARELLTPEGRAKARRRLSRIYGQLVEVQSTRSVDGRPRAAEDAYVRKQEAFYDAIAKWSANALLADMEIVLFRAADQKLAAGCDAGRDYGWHSYLGKPIEVVNVPGDHLGMLRNPNVAELGKKVKERLARTNVKQPQGPERQQPSDLPS